jgi:hypothetical protein
VAVLFGHTAAGVAEHAIGQMILVVVLRRAPFNTGHKLRTGVDVFLRGTVHRCAVLILGNHLAAGHRSPISRAA